MVDEVAGGSPEERDGGAKVAGGWASPEKASRADLVVARETHTPETGGAWRRVRWCLPKRLSARWSPEGGGSGGVVTTEKGRPSDGG